jgi:hypothetical protein
VAAGSALVDACIVAFFVVSGALGAGAQAGAFVADDSDETATAEDAEGDLEGDHVGFLALLGARWQFTCRCLVWSRL